jgi:hypothetical protein
MAKKDLQKLIRKHEGLILSDGTLKTESLLATAYDCIVDFNMREGELLKDIAKAINLKDGLVRAQTADYHGHLSITDEEEASYLWNEDVFNKFNELAPKGYYFGSSDGDGACIGFFKAEGDE